MQKFYGLDISDYAISNSKPEIRDRLQVGNAIDLPWDDNTFDLVISITTLHNLYAYDLDLALREMERVGKEHKIYVESYRNEQEKMNLFTGRSPAKPLTHLKNGTGGLSTQITLEITPLFILNKPVSIAYDLYGRWLLQR